MLQRPMLLSAKPCTQEILPPLAEICAARRGGPHRLKDLVPAVAPFYTTLLNRRTRRVRRGHDIKTPV